MTKGMAELPVVPVPSGLRLQPVDPRDVAARLTELTLGEPAGRVADLVGPTVCPMADLVRSYLAVGAKRRPLMPLPLPGKAGRAYRAGANLTLHGADTASGPGRTSWPNASAERQADRAARTAASTGPATTSMPLAHTP